MKAHCILIIFNGRFCFKKSMRELHISSMFLSLGLAVETVILALPGIISLGQNAPLLVLEVRHPLGSPPRGQHGKQNML